MAIGLIRLIPSLVRVTIGVGSAIIGGTGLYVGQKELAKKVCDSEFFSKKPFKIEGGKPYYKGDELGDLVNKKIPVKSTNNTIDGEEHWSNDSRYVKNSLDMWEGRFLPTHYLKFTPVGNNEYRFDIEGAE